MTTVTVVCHEGGQEIHKAGCKELARWAKWPYMLVDFNEPTLTELAWHIWGDMIDESMTLDEAVKYTRKAFKPCAAVAEGGV